jgi:vacuolar protein sorting-associated protein 13A/C
VKQLLNRTISPYVDNLNPDDLNVAVMAGDLTLHNLHLKRSAVDKYNLPVEVVEGECGHRARLQANIGLPPILY